jgi:hypothetical protein
MYSTRTAITISLRDILDRLTDLDIYTYCIGQFKVGKLMNSPLRTTDNNPSFGIFQAKNGGLLYKDLGTGDCGNALKFLKEYKGITTREELERELLRIVRRINPNLNTRANTYDKPKGETDIGIVRQSFTAVDKQYWKQFGIHIDTLKKYNVFSIKYFLCNSVVKGTYKETSPMYAYKVYDKFKIYRPLASKFTKWRTNLTNRHVQGLAELPKEGGELLIITKSLKDVMCCYEMGFNAIAAASETVFIPEDILKSLRTKWKRVVILYDRDATGVHKARSYSRQYKLDAFFINKKFKAKDLSDAVKLNGFTVVKDWLKKELSRYD